jgi:hypothetical protein
MSKNGWAFLLSVGALVIVWFLFQRRGRTIERLLLEAQTQVARNEIRRLKAELNYDRTDEKVARYNDLKRQHRDLVAKLGLRLVEPDANQSDAKGNPADN